MILDAGDIPKGTHLSFDLCIIGAGPAGLTLASRLAAPGRQICLLESGGVVRDRATDRLAAGASTGRPYHPLHKAGVRALGGSSNHWHAEAPGPWPVDGGMRSRPLDPVDFEQRSWVSESGWPIRAEELTPYYGRAEAMCGMVETLAGGAEGDLASLEVRRIIAGSVESSLCGYAPREMFELLAGRVATTPEVTLLLHANAVSLDLDAAGSVASSVTVRTLGGNRFSVSARAFVLAAGGIENARLLLASDSRQRLGIGNEHGQVGRYFMDHVEFEAATFAPVARRALPDLDFFRRRYVAGEAVIGVLRLPDSTQRNEGLLNTVATLRPRSRLFVRPAVRAAADLFGAAQQAPRHLALATRVAAMASDPGSVAGALALKLSGRAARNPEVATLILTSEQVPNPLSRITLDTRRDPLGMPRAVLHWRTTELEAWSFERTRSLIAEALAKAGLQPLRPAQGPGVYRGCWHHAGTTRMGLDPRRSVVDPSCRVHGVANLYVAGSSVMPTAGATTITLTIVALALRLADHLERELAS